MQTKFDDIALEDLIEWTASGSSKIPPKLQEYALLLERIWGMYRRHLDFPNSAAIINYLVTVNGFQRYEAKRLLTDAEIFFSSELQKPKDIWRAQIADLMKKNYVFAISVAKTAKDGKEANTILLQMAQVLDLSKEDVADVADDLMRQIQILSADVTLFGEEKEDRNELARQIDALPDVPENVKERAKLEIDTFPLRLMKSYDVEQENSKEKDGGA